MIFPLEVKRIANAIRKKIGKPKIKADRLNKISKARLTGICLTLQSRASCSKKGWLISSIIYVSSNKSFFNRYIQLIKIEQGEIKFNSKNGLRYYVKAILKIYSSWTEKMLTHFAY
jgi:hypothetical protein